MEPFKSFRVKWFANLLTGLFNDPELSRLLVVDDPSDLVIREAVVPGVRVRAQDPPNPRKEVPARPGRWPEPRLSRHRSSTKDDAPDQLQHRVDMFELKRRLASSPGEAY